MVVAAGVGVVVQSNDSPFQYGELYSLYVQGDCVSECGGD